ncbi:hypothetical protein L7F22_038587 [Adiantum nelumboides]|nr:hypothetical protein [Adiantum nelumboides]
MAPGRGSRIPGSILQDTELRTALSQIWVGDISHTQGAAQLLASCIDASSIACRLTVSERRRHLFSRERQLQDRLVCIRRRLQEFSGDTFLGDMQRETVDTLTHLQEEKSEFSYHASVFTWISKADRMNKDFFSCFRQRPAGTMVRALRDSMGQLHTCPDDILEMASVFYETLFTSDLLTRDVLDAKDEVWSFVRRVVSGDISSSKCYVEEYCFYTRSKCCIISLDESKEPVGGIGSRFVLNSASFPKVVQESWKLEVV